MPGVDLRLEPLDTRRSLYRVSEDEVVVLRKGLFRIQVEIHTDTRRESVTTMFEGTEGEAEAAGKEIFHALAPDMNVVPYS